MFFPKCIKNKIFNEKSDFNNVAVCGKIGDINDKNLNFLCYSQGLGF